MSQALVHITEVPQMSACGYCPKPGYCCQSFDLSNSEGQLTFWRENWQEDAAAFLRDRELPFEATGIRESFEAKGLYVGGVREYVTLWYRCPKLTPEGRCSIYETRPETCRIYVPGSTPLCVLQGVI